MVKPEEIEPGATSDELHDPRFLGLRSQAEAFEQRGQLHQGSFSLVSGSTDHQQIIGVADQPPIGGTPCPVETTEVDRSPTAGR